MTLEGMPKPTAQVQIYVDVLGIDQAVDCFLTLGGADQQFSRNPGPKSDLAKCIGLENARELGRRLGNMRRRVPTAKPWVAQVLHAKGLSAAEISRKLHTTDVTVRKWIKVARADWEENPAQLDLFSEQS